MNIILIVVGKTDEEWLSKGIEEYKNPYRTLHTL